MVEAGKERGVKDRLNLGWPLWQTSTENQEKLHNSECRKRQTELDRW